MPHFHHICAFIFSASSRSFSRARHAYFHTSRPPAFSIYVYFVIILFLFAMMSLDIPLLSHELYTSLLQQARRFTIYYIICDFAAVAVCHFSPQMMMSRPRYFHFLILLSAMPSYFTAIPQKRGAYHRQYASSRRYRQFS